MKVNLIDQKFALALTAIAAVGFVMGFILSLFGLFSYVIVLFMGFYLRKSKMTWSPILAIAFGIFLGGLPLFFPSYYSFSYLIEQEKLLSVIFSIVATPFLFIKSATMHDFWEKGKNYLNQGKGWMLN
ncbi:MAG: hypothetical protein WDZ80_02585 [Candidatus Paceibacterota bacterium]